ncbi:hypothetical protein ASPWEDRAFT_171407 [Aspergillus wentii DTO 134E9]|uniref:AMP-dependent synthetase/ligase domain-containing protein n=1 Tax=Aspergillus wentii DTO 134E9 TaxID=1073089 RepID=A0A1L9RST3_ASPWE|nr:uncharacterized protein ASPWEDRAFT_171407 [Aspergillus wentii DTO 134E9]OJJ37954.1 hypothetical protein ASPWEDRAFT_171407 [Aspergillus wentii DTO 134E9]
MSIHRSTVWVEIPNITIAELMQDNVENTPPDKIIYEESHTGKTATYGVFHRRIRQTAYNLAKIGFQPGQILSISAGSSIEYILVAQAVWYVGGVVSLINNSLHPDEFRHAVDLVKPDYLVVDESLYTKLPGVLERSTHCKAQSIQIFSIGKISPSYPPFPINTSPSLNEPELAHPMPPGDPSKTCAAILLSSGTTGRSKAVMLSHTNLVAACYQLRTHNPSNWNIHNREIFFPPLSHVYALYVCFTMCAWLGMYVCLMPRFELETYCRLMSERKASIARIVPPIAKMLAERKEVRKFEYPCLEYFSCSAAPLHEDTAAKLREAFPGAVLAQTYGCTELSGPCIQSGARDKDILTSSTAAGTLIANSEIRFLDTDGKDVGAKGPGEITCRGPNVMMGYKDNAEETAKAIQNGWLRTGDLGFIDQNDCLHIYDRIKDLIKYKGFQLAPSELENILILHPLVQEAAVIGIWSENEATEVPRAFVVLKSKTADVCEIAAFVASRVSNYKALRGGVVVVDALPKNPTGKVLKKQLRVAERENKL